MVRGKPSSALCTAYWATWISPWNCSIPRLSERAVEAGLGVGCLSHISLQDAFKRGSLVPLNVPHRDFQPRDVYHHPPGQVPQYRPAPLAGCVPRLIWPLNPIIYSYRRMNYFMSTATGWSEHYERPTGFYFAWASWAAVPRWRAEAIMVALRPMLFRLITRWS